MTAVGSDRGEIDEMTRGILIRPLKLVFFFGIGFNYDYVVSVRDE